MAKTVNLTQNVIKSKTQFTMKVFFFVKGYIKSNNNSVAEMQRTEYLSSNLSK